MKSQLEALEQRKVEKRNLKLGNYKKIEEAAYKWFDGQITDKRMAEIVFGLINGEVKECQA